MSKRSTVQLSKLLQYANGFLAAKGGTAESRYGVICVLESALFSAKSYHGFTYLAENAVGLNDRPGIRWNLGESSFDNTDPTRRSYN